MDIKSRRKLGLALVVGGAVVAGVVASGVTFAAGSQRKVERYWTSAVVADDGSAQVTEVIDYDFGLNQRRGIFRWVPGLDPATPITVSSPDAPDQVEITQTFETDRNGEQVAGTDIRIGDPNTTITGEHRYRIEYPLPGVVQGAQLDWEAVGIAWEVPMNEVEVHLVTPFVVENPLCTHGPARSTDTCSIREVEPGHLVATVDRLDDHEGVSIEGTQGAPLSAVPATPEAPADPPAEESTNPLVPGGVVAGSAAVAALAARRLVRRTGRERVYSGGAADAAFGGPPLGGTAPWPTSGPATVGASTSNAWVRPTPTSAVPPPPPVPGAVLPGTEAITSALPGALLPGATVPSTVAAGTVPPGGVSGPAAPGQASTPFGQVPEPETWTGVAPPPGAAEERVDAAELQAMSTIEFAPPAGVTPAHGGIILRETVQPEHKVAWLIQAAIDGVVDLDDAAATTSVTRRYERPGTPEQQAVLGTMFARKQTIELGTFDSDFADGWNALGSQLSFWRKGSGLWDERGNTLRVVALVFGILGALAGGLFVLGAGALAGFQVGGPAWVVAGVIGGLLVGAGLAAAIGAWELRVRTAAGSSLWLRVESFRRFLAESEGYHADEAARRGILREYTAWAVAVGEIDRWGRAVASSTVAPQAAGLDYVYMAPLLLASTSSTATPPSSSGGGGFGGDFGGGDVGGGAGGGGGGDW